MCESGIQDGMVIWCECVAGVEGKVFLFCLVGMVVCLVGRKGAIEVSLVCYS